jgi:sec-independent protein translocase protein TatA
MDLFAPWHIVILVVAFMVLFGARKLPGAAQSLGQAMRIFKSETKGLINDDDDKQSAPNDARAEAARLEAQAGPQELNAPKGDSTVNGVPLQQTEHGKHS